MQYQSMWACSCLVCHSFRRFFNQLTSAFDQVMCRYCQKKFYPDRLKVHLRYFCGPNAKKSTALAKQKRKKGECFTSGERKRGACDTSHTPTWHRSMSCRTSRLDCSQAGQRLRKCRNGSGRRKYSRRCQNGWLAGEVDVSACVVHMVKLIHCAVISTGCCLPQFQKRLTCASNRACIKRSVSQCEWSLKSVLAYVLGAT